MMTTIRATKKFEQALKRHPHPDIVQSKIRFLAQNPHHNSLNVHRLRGVKDRDIWDCYITDSERLLFEVKGGALCLWDLGSHAVVDKVHRRRFTDHVYSKLVDISSQMSIFSLPKENRTVVEASSVPPVILESESLYNKDESAIPSNELSVSTTEKHRDNTFDHLSYKMVNGLSFFEDTHLRILGIPDKLVSAIKAASSLEDALKIPGLAEDVCKRLEEAYTSPKLHELMFDESLLIYRTSIENFEGYCGGKIKELMLDLQPKQRACVEITETPFILVKGTAGSGKTAIGIYRAIRLAMQGRHVLLVTFNKNLTISIKSLIVSLIGELPMNLNVMSLYQEMDKILRSRSIRSNKGVVEGGELRNFLRKALNDVKSYNNSTIFQRGEQFFEEEIQYVIQGRDVESLEVYKKIEREGRGKRIGERQREAIWKVYGAYRSLLRDARREDWSDIACSTLQTLQERPLDDLYDDVIVDEAQDLTLVERYVIQHLVVPLRDRYINSGSMMILADTAQALYSRSFSWKELSNQTKTKTERLQKNYRNTRQIADAATHLFEYNTRIYDPGEYIKPELTIRHGPSPILVTQASTEDIFFWIGERIRDLLTNHTFHLSDFAVLCRTHLLCEKCKLQFDRVGLSAMLQGKDFDPLSSSIKIITLHSAKGLEFPVVFLLMSPIANDVDDDEDLRLELLERERTLCYVGMTRASDALYLLTVKGEESVFVSELEGKIIPW